MSAQPSAILSKNYSDIDYNKYKYRFFFWDKFSSEVKQEAFSSHYTGHDPPTAP